MKKNKIMRFASALLVLAMLTTCVISGTFAKYTTKVEGTDTARVAKWGFKAADSTVTLDNLFKKTYDKNVEGAVDVIAPGTTNSAQFGFTYDGTGAPEVAYTFTVNPTITGDYTSLDTNKNFKWTLQKTGKPVVEYNTVAELLDAIKALSGDASGSKEYAAGQLPTDFTATGVTYSIGWEWAYSVDAAGDAADTTMGNAPDLNNVTFAITVTATQID